MTREEVRQLIEEQVPKFNGDWATVMSLDKVAVQMAVEEKYGIRFATGANDRTELDVRWDECKTVDDLVDLIREGS